MARHPAPDYVRVPRSELTEVAALFASLKEDFPSTWTFTEAIRTIDDIDALRTFSLQLCQMLETTNGTLTLAGDLFARYAAPPGTVS